MVNTSHSDPYVLTRFQEQLAKAAALPGLARASAALWPRFAGDYQGLARLPRKVRRALPLWRRSLGSLALLCALASVPAMAATINVGVNDCTLVDAITAANSSVATGNCPAGDAPFCQTEGCTSGTDTIVLPTRSTQTLTSVVSNNTGLPLVTSIITINGNGSIIRRDPAAPQFRILNVDTTGSLTLREATVSGGLVSVPSGGGIRNEGTLVIVNSTVSGNSAANTSGGGVANFGTMTLTNSTVSGNSARFGGGVWSNGTLSLINSTITDNGANAHGGGLDNADNGTLNLTQTLVSRNSAVEEGEELYNHIVDGTGTINANNHNLFGHDGNARVVGFTPGDTDIVPNEPVGFILDAALTDTGGPTKTHNLIINSPAIDAAPTSDGSCVNNTDQRGFFRPNDGNADGVFDCDIGSVEAGPPPPTITRVSPLPSGTSGQAYGPVILTATNGQPPLRWSGTPPAGLTLSQSGVISGTPTAAGTASFNTTVTDSANPTRSNTKSFQITIFEPPPPLPPPPRISTVSLPSGTRGQPYGSVLAATGGVAPLRWSGVPPAGLSLSQTGAISGTPVVPGNFFFDVTVTDSASPARADTRSFQITVREPPAPEAAPTVPNPPVPSTSAGCRVRLTCPLSLSPVAGCINRVKVFVKRKVLRSTGAALKASGRVRFCGAIANVPAGQTLRVKLRPTTQGRAIIRAGNRKSIRGTMKISNMAGAIISSTPVRIRVR